MESNLFIQSGPGSRRMDLKCCRMNQCACARIILHYLFLMSIRLGTNPAVVSLRPRIQFFVHSKQWFRPSPDSLFPHILSHLTHLYSPWPTCHECHSAVDWLLTRLDLHRDSSTITNETKVLQFFLFFHSMRAQKNRNQTQHQCSVGGSRRKTQRLMEWTSKFSTLHLQFFL